MNTKVGGIAVFTLLLGRAITLKRIQYYRAEGHILPDAAHCVQVPAKAGFSYPGPDTVITLPPTPERLVIDEAMISSCMADFKRQLLKR